ncbi:male gamete fusion factor HAP2, putative [Plasmodium reichenowi]|uniref:Male gamete fusion factor HAP2, putative n=1 Tax=Plasmodium reichenowi TaxID=5854 RepID=A0A060RTG9_PLARE|nr:male gamete fusion factor HAP2, putative [Plasmodium reichenowi]SOV79731.1 male gamete fusion factor HAP2, putative [Plasmodium reichenowi]
MNKRKKTKHLKVNSILRIFFFLFLISFLFSNCKLNDYIRTKYPFIQFVYSYSKKKVCTSSTDDSTCRTVVYGDLDVSNNSVLRLKVLRSEGKGYFVTIRRDYVTISYYLKYMKDIPLKYREVVDIFNNHKYEKYTEKQIKDFTYNCTAIKVEDANNTVGDFAPHYHEYTRGESCICPSYHLFKNDNSIKRAKLKCTYFNMLFTDSAIVYSRHCAIMDLFYFSVYEIDYPPIFNTYIDITIQEYTYDDVSGMSLNKHDLVTKEKKYEINDSMSEIRDDYFDLWLFLRGERHGKRTLINLSNDYVVIPSSPLDDADVIETDVMRNCGLKEDNPALKGCDYKHECNIIHPCLLKAMMLPKYLFDLSGKTCNKLGVSLNKWRNSDGNFCGSSAGYCLSENLFKYYYIHKTSVGNRKPSKYKIKNIYGSEPQTKVYTSAKLPNYLKDKVDSSNNKSYDINDIDNKIFYNENAAAHSHFIDYKYNGNHTVEIKFETNALEVHEIRPVSYGTITHITIPKDCSSNQTNSKECILVVHTWNNNKTIGANFSCHVLCVDKSTQQVATHISPISKINAHIDANKNYAFYFIIKFLINKKITSNCTAILKDADGRECSKLSFNLTSKETINVVESGIVAQPVESEAEINKYDPDVAGASTSTTDKCDCYFNLLCYILNLNTCVSYYTKLIKDYLGRFVTIAILIFLAPSLIPLLPFIIKFFISCASLPMKLFSNFSSWMENKKKSNNSTKQNKNYFQSKYENFKKKRTNMKKNKCTSSSVSSLTNDSSISSNNTMHSDIKKDVSFNRIKSNRYNKENHKNKKSKTKGNHSKYSGTSMESTLTNTSTSSIPGNLSESHITSNSNKNNYSSKKKSKCNMLYKKEHSSKSKRKKSMGISEYSS